MCWNLAQRPPDDGLYIVNNSQFRFSYLFGLTMSPEIDQSSI